MTSAIAVWAAFPVTLFAMIVIQGLGIQEGMAVFVIALCIVGWGEIAQFVRAQVIALKPQLYVEAARTVGARAGRILTQHVLPQLGPALLVMAVLEMGSVLMLLAELGFLNIFLGGGFRAAIAEGANMVPIIYYFSDVPEWAAMLANIRNWWRSYPWMAWYPGLGFLHRHPRLQPGRPGPAAPAGRCPREHRPPLRPRSRWPSGCSCWPACSCSCAAARRWSSTAGRRGL